MSYFDLYEPSDFGELNRMLHVEERCYNLGGVNHELDKHEYNEF